MNFAIEHDRAAQLVLAADARLDWDSAVRRLETAALQITVDETAERPWAQAALVAAAAAGTRMFRGGVFVDPTLAVQNVLGQCRNGPLRRYLVELGCIAGAPPPHALNLHVGPMPRAGAKFVCWADGWSAKADARGPISQPREGNELSGALAAALGVEEAFRRAVLGDPRACRRPLSLNAWGEGAPDCARLRRVPSRLWWLGIGNLGQAGLFLYGHLPFEDPGEVRLLLQDDDRAGAENLPVQVLTRPDWLGRRKARAAADWAEALGFDVTVCEQRFGALTSPHGDDPRVLIAGVDNLEARRCAAAAGFDLVVDAGLGASAKEAFDLRLHAFPGRRSAEEAWPETPGGDPVGGDAPAEEPLPKALQDLVDCGRLDRCGAVTIAGKSVGVPCTAVAAAALQLAQVCRAIETGRCCDLIDVPLTDTSRMHATAMASDLAANLFFTKARV